MPRPTPPAQHTIWQGLRQARMKYCTDGVQETYSSLVILLLALSPPALANYCVVYIQLYTTTHRACPQNA